MTGAQRLIVSVMTSLGLTGLATVGACSSAYAPADPPDAGTAGDATTSSSDDAATTTGDAAPATDANLADVEVDAPPACPPPKKPNGNACSNDADCCSGACSANRQCTATCKDPGLGNFCAANADCCVGSFCSPITPFTCKNCIPLGAMAEKVAGTFVSASCCSGSADVVTGVCRL